MSKEQEINLEKETDKVSPADVSIITRADVMAEIQSEYFHADRGWVLVADKDISCIAYSPASQGVYCDVREALQAIEPYKLGSKKPRKKESTKQEHDGECEETEKQMDSLIADCIQLFVQDPQSNNVEEDREWEDQGSAQELCRSILKKSGYYDDLEQGQTSSSQTLLWVDKYKPQDSRQVLCDIAWKDLPMDPAAFISEWLRGWNENIQDNRTKKQKAAKMKKGRKTTVRNTKLPHCNALLLKGRTGASCKTAMVYACAQEHHYRILEEPQETSPSLEHSLVLFEEVDVVFDQDKGFFSAVAALIRESKRPIVLTCNELTPEVRQALESNGINILLLEFEGPLERDLLLYLQLVCAAEQMPMHAITSASDDLRLLIQHMKLDVRQLLMTLQLWCCENSATLKKDKRASQQSLEDKKLGLDFGRMIGFRRLTILQVLFGMGMEQQRIDPQEREIFLRHAFDHNFQLDLLWHNYLSIFECPSLDNSRFTFKPPKELLEREGTIDDREEDASSTASIKEKVVDLQSISNQDSTMDVLALVADSLSYCDLIDSYFDSAVEIDHVLHDGVPEITFAHHLCAQLQITSGGQVGTLLSATQTPSVLADLRCKQPFVNLHVQNIAEIE
ncbi:AAA domain-containing protein [Balamuthia mandrillaris]